MGRRSLVLDGAAWSWATSHSHAGEVCAELFWARRDGAPGELRLAIHDDDDEASTTASGGYGARGVVIVRGRTPNFNRPRVAEALVRQALKEGWDPAQRGSHRPAQPVDFILRALADLEDEDI